MKTALVVGLIAMWITYAVTQSVGVSWVVFFVAGGVFVAAANQQGGAR